MSAVKRYSFNYGQNCVQLDDTGNFVTHDTYQALLTETRWAMQQIVYLADHVESADEVERAEKWLADHPEPAAAAPEGA